MARVSKTRFLLCAETSPKRMKFQEIIFIFCIIYSSFILNICRSSESSPKKDVLIFHLINNADWGEVDGTALQGVFSCPASNKISKCELISSDTQTNYWSHLLSKYKARMNALTPEEKKKTITVSLYHIHTWNTLSRRPFAPDKLSLPTDLTMAESEESTHRFQKLFATAFPNYDGSSTTHPETSVPRTYFRGWNTSEFIEPKPFSQLIKGAAFVASTCHRGDGNTKRMAFVRELMQTIRVDSLGKCMQTKSIPEGIHLTHGQTAEESLRLKQQAISNYMFYLAFENTNEPGYVTEKVFDGLIAGVVPVYLGASEDCQKLMPREKNVVVFTSDFQNDPQKVGAFLQSLTQNQSLYESYRSWRNSFDPMKGSDLITKSWPCRICEWAVTKMEQKKEV